MSPVRAEAGLRLSCPFQTGVGSHLHCRCDVPGLGGLHGALLTTSQSSMWEGAGAGLPAPWVVSEKAGGAIPTRRLLLAVQGLSSPTSPRGREAGGRLGSDQKQG